MCRLLIKSTKVSRTFFLILCCGSPVLRSLILHSSSTLPTLKNIYIIAQIRIFGYLSPSIRKFGGNLMKYKFFPNYFKTFSCLPQAQRAHESQDYKDTFGSQSFRLSKKKYPIIRSTECHVNKRYRGTLAQSVESWSVEWKPVTGSIPSKKMKRLAFCPANG